MIYIVLNSPDSHPVILYYFLFFSLKLYMLQNLETESGSVCVTLEMAHIQLKKYDRNQGLVGTMGQDIYVNWRNVWPEAYMCVSQVRVD